MIRPLVLLSAFALLGCPQEPRKPPADSGACEAACARVAADGGLACEVGRPTAGGRTCVQVCRTVESHGAPFSGCLLRATTCEQADTCQ